MACSQWAARNCEVAGGADVVAEGEEEEGCGVGGGVLVAEGLPGHVGGQVVCHLGELVHHLAVGALAVKQELERALREGGVAVAVDGVERPEGVAAEVPAEAGASGVVGGEPAGDEAGLGFPVCTGTSQVFHLGVFDGEFSPAEGLVELGIGGVNGEAGVEEVGVVVVDGLRELGQVVGLVCQALLHGLLGCCVVGFAGLADGGEQGKEAALVACRVVADEELEG